MWPSVGDGMPWTIVRWKVALSGVPSTAAVTVKVPAVSEGKTGRKGVAPSLRASVSLAVVVCSVVLVGSPGLKTPRAAPA